MRKTVPVRSSQMSRAEWFESLRLKQVPSGGLQNASRAPYLKKQETGTREMVKSLKLVDTVPIVLGAKAKQ